MTIFKKIIWWTFGVLATMPLFFLMKFGFWVIDQFIEWGKMHQEMMDPGIDYSEDYDFSDRIE